MARKTIEITITDEGRDKGKVYVITEMPARKAEKWATRLGKELTRGAARGIAREIDENSGWAGIAAIGLSALSEVSWQVAEPLMDEMLTCVSFRPDPNNPAVVRPLMADDDVEEITTLGQLRWEAMNLHINFTLAEFLLRLRTWAMRISATSKNTATSPVP